MIHRYSEQKEVKNMDQITLTMAEACEIIGVSMPTLRGFLHRQADPLPAMRAGRRWLISRNGLEEWLQRQCENRVN